MTLPHIDENEINTPERNNVEYEMRQWLNNRNRNYTENIYTRREDDWERFVQSNVIDTSDYLHAIFYNLWNEAENNNQHPLNEQDRRISTNIPSSCIREKEVCVYYINRICTYPKITNWETTPRESVLNCSMYKARPTFPDPIDDLEL